MSSGRARAWNDLGERAAQRRGPALGLPLGDEAGRRAQRHRLVALAVIRPVVGTAIVVTLYYWLPLDRAFNTHTVVILGLGLVAVGVLVAVQIRAIARSDFPRLRAMAALGTSVPLFLITFAVTYFLIAREQSAAFSESLGRTDALYFTVTVFSTVGFGDITPVTQLARSVAMGQMVGDLILIGLIGRVIVGAVTVGVQRQVAVPPQPGEGAPQTSGESSERDDSGVRGA